MMHKTVIAALKVQSVWVNAELYLWLCVCVCVL